MSQKEPSFIVSLLSGGFAGTSVDVALYPLDTIKTRLQSAEGFWKTGGFRGVYKGLGIAAIGSSPGAALFFCTYEMSKQYLGHNHSNIPLPVIHMIAASLGETLACVVRVPTEVIKQRLQAGQHATIREAIRHTWATGGNSPRAFYTGFDATLMREIPYSLIQFPLYEALKGLWSKKLGRQANSLE
eukprot:gene43671-58170_t